MFLLRNAKMPPIIGVVPSKSLRVDDTELDSLFGRVDLPVLVVLLGVSGMLLISPVSVDAGHTCTIYSMI